MTAEPDMDVARKLFAALEQQTGNSFGIHRASYGAGEQRAHDLVEEIARSNGLEVDKDDALNLYVTLPGRDRTAPVVMSGSHLDSVPAGGNFDGAAGVAAALSVLVGWKKSAHVPAVDTTMIAIRAEESCWFPVSYIGSKAAFGILPEEALSVARSDNGCSLAGHLSQLGGAPERIAAGAAKLSANGIDRFIELHIEQGPVLLEADESIGLVTGVRGSFRYRSAQARGQYAHSGATPRRLRQDAVLAVSHLITALSTDWERLETNGADLTVTFGRVQTEAERADFSKVAGIVDFCIDVRSFDTAVLAEVERLMGLHVTRITEETGVSFRLGKRTSSKPAVMDQHLRRDMLRAARDIGISAREMPCGAGHDAAVFANQGVPTAMIFVRNANGSHNPDESMEFDDFTEATRLLARTLAL